MCLNNIEKQAIDDDRSLLLLWIIRLTNGGEQREINLQLEFFQTETETKIRSGLHQPKNLRSRKSLLDAYCELLLCLLFLSRTKKKLKSKTLPSVDLHKYLDPRERAREMFVLVIAGR